MHEDVLSRGFGTAKIYTDNLTLLGWRAVDVVANHVNLQRLWSENHGSGAVDLNRIVLDQIEQYDPSVVFCHDLSFLTVESLNEISRAGRILAGQCSCPLPDLNKVSRFDILFTSFVHYVKKFEALGVKAFYVPLGFEPSQVDFAFPAVFPAVPTETIEMDFGRIHDCVFVGGVGNPSHWQYGMEVLNAVAANIPTFKWWGYGLDTLPKGSPLRPYYQGEAWGVKMIEVLLQAKICLNRHGEVAGPYANNQRLFEVTGCGAMLITDAKENLHDFFTPDECVPYRSPTEAAGLVKYYLEHNEERAKIAKAGQERTLRDHTYAKRMKQVADILEKHL